MKINTLVSSSLLASALYLNAFGSTLFVPSRYPTIQSAIDASTHRDTILVSPGTYSEAINFRGKAIVVMSSNGPVSTRIDAPALYAVTFDSGEDSLSVLCGFSIGPAEATAHSSWNGVLCSGSSPTISGNIVERLRRAIVVIKGSPTIERNIVQEGVWFDNSSGFFIVDTCSPMIVNNIVYGYYQGIRISGSTPIILFNTIDHNKYGIFGADSCTIKNNVITNGSYGILAVPSPRIVLSHNNVWNNSIQTFDLNYQNCSPGEGDISADPLYGADSPSYRLQTTSPCIDAGVDAGVYEDFDCHVRPSGKGFDIGAFERGFPTAVLDRVLIVPGQFSLSQNYPNPFNSQTAIRYSLDEGSEITIKIYDVLGKLVHTLINKKQSHGTYIVFWNAENQQEYPLASGVYFCRLQKEDEIKSIKLILMR